MKTPSPWLVLAFGAVLLAAYLAPSPEEDDVQLSARARVSVPSPVTAQPRAAAHAPVEVLRIQPREAPALADAARWFAVPATVVTTTVARPTAAPLEPSVPPPQAPPLPFKALGQYIDAGEVGVFLQYRDQNLVARVGDTLAEQYKVESLVEGVLTLRYLPLNQTQTLDIDAVH
jgi:hypothetical protein